MKFEIEKSEKIELDIKEPSFYKSENRLLGVINEDNVISMYKSDSLTMIQSGKKWIMSSDLRKIPEMFEITEEQFMQDWEAAVNSFSLTPKIVSNENTI